MLPPRTAQELELIQFAYWLCKTAHRDQFRDDGQRVFEHPRRAAISLIKNGYHDTETIILILLHDIFEDTTTPDKVILNLFGASTCERMMTISKKIPKFDPVTGQLVGRVAKSTEEYFAKLAGAELKVRLSKCADREDNLSDMNGFEIPRKRKYVDETQEYIIPIARNTCPIYTRSLELLANQADAELIALGA
jgi:(p)ppGpp synthase/HD superfamily hydrolase